jgi:hypothetical protein
MINQANAKPIEPTMPPEEIPRESGVFSEEHGS